MNKQHILVCWVGAKDLNVSAGEGLGPILATLRAVEFDRVELLYNYPESRVIPWLNYLRGQVSPPIEAHYEPLSSPVHFGEIYQVAARHLKRLAFGASLSIQMTPGTPAMQAVWILLGKTRYPVTFYQSSLEQGVERVDIPFEIAAEYVPAANALSGKKLAQLSTRDVPIDAAFNSIVTQNPRLQQLIQQAQILATRLVPVLIYGETGTGKELFARAIHNAGPRASAPFIAVNCGAIPPELVDSTLFGHLKGSFTGAVQDRSGVFQQAHGGTLFLDEFGELTPDVQVRLLRVLQEGVITPVGGAQAQKVDIRLISATHRNLMQEVGQGRFREDLFYRIAVGVLHLPPLRDREGDIFLLVQTLLQEITRQDASLVDKRLSPEALKQVQCHLWRGNVRELQATLVRAALWSSEETITAEDIRQALFTLPEDKRENTDIDISQGVNLPALVSSFARNYIQHALAFTGQNKTKAARLLGFNSHQTLSNWIKKNRAE
ncbi:sigma-54 interaction domain-containing protein [Aeromonas media]|uniref:sigma-54 interaction domain-containing protein n=1 Tax=Aeromonas media TaxID=651 RepID=UPI002281FD2D|nr:sigma-54 dependent transcriptional regulator [Aeromonas media]MCY9824134.1 sigma-54 dependent transcriptional regulator [Aeromonas media]